MNRGAASVLTADGTRERSGTVAPPARRGVLRRALGGFGDSCVRCGVALLACLALIAVGTLGSLLWMLLVER